MAKIYHQSHKPILKFTTHHGTEIIADLSAGLKMMEEDFNQRKEELMFKQMLEGYMPKTKEEAMKMKYEGGKQS